MKLAVKLLFLLALIFIFAGAAWAARAVKGDVIVTFENPFPDTPVTQESLSKWDGVHAAWVAETAKELDASVKMIYDALSIQGNDIAVVLHSDTKSENELWLDVKLRRDVKAASLNHIATIARPRGSFAR